MEFDTKNPRKHAPKELREYIEDRFNSGKKVHLTKEVMRKQ